MCKSDPTSPNNIRLRYSHRVEAINNGRLEASFLDQINYPPADGRREKLLAHFNVPSFVGNQTCTELNGYFGSKASYSDENTGRKITSFSKQLPACAITT